MLLRFIGQVVLEYALCDGLNELISFTREKKGKGARTQPWHQEWGGLIPDQDRVEMVQVSPERHQGMSPEEHYAAHNLGR